MIDKLEADLNCDLEAEMVCKSAREFARLVGVSDRTVSDWKSRGMPHQPGNPSPIAVGPALHWLRENGLLGMASRQQASSSGRVSDGDDSPSAQHLRDLFEQMDSAIEAGQWSRALHLMLGEIDMFQGRPVTVDEILNEIDADDCTSGSAAVRVRGTRVYVWPGMHRDFADALTGLVNMGMVHAHADESPSDSPREDFPWAKWLDLPLVKDLANPPKSDCRVDLAFSANADGAVSIQLEAVTKPSIQPVDSSDQLARESALLSIGNLNGLQTAKDRKAWLDSVEAELKKARKAK